MPAGKLYVFSGPIRSGKTTALHKWVSRQTGICGILTPDREGLRWMWDIGSQRWIPFEVSDNSTEAVVEIGRFRFLASSFAFAQQVLRSAIAQQSPWIVVDEVGKLEMKGLGFEPVITELIAAHRAGTYAGNLLLVVREELLQAFLDKWDIQAWEPFLPDSPAAA